MSKACGLGMELSGGDFQSAECCESNSFLQEGAFTSVDQYRDGPSDTARTTWRTCSRESSAVQLQWNFGGKLTQPKSSVNLHYNDDYPL